MTTDTTDTTGTTKPTGTGGRAWALGYQHSWDRQQEVYMPDREERFRVMLDMVEAFAGAEPRVLDLACGTGSITARLLDRFPNATSTGVDLDPALLTIARGTFEGDARVSFVEADLKDPDWPARLPYDTYDAVLTATALHWLRTDALDDLYGRLAGLVRHGGVFMNADHMPDDTTPRINAAESVQRHARMGQAQSDGALDWAEWWARAAKDPVLAGATARRFEIYGDHADGEMPPAAWHARTLLAHGFGEARPVWCSPADTLLLALK